MRLAYRCQGSGPLLVCHPGGPGFSGSSLTDLGGLADSFECLVVDPRGTGSSPAADTFSQEEYVADLEELRAELGLEQFDLLGHSHGGFVATQSAATHPERVRRLVLVTTAPRFSSDYSAATGIDDARVVVLVDAGHYIWIDQPGAFASEVATFLPQ